MAYLNVFNVMNKKLFTYIINIRNKNAKSEVFKVYTSGETGRDP